MATQTATRKRAPARRKRAAAPAEGKQHIHHWLIAPPNGPVSVGECSCGATREFRNSTDDSIWDRTEGRSRWNDMGVARRRKPEEGSSN